ncbi:MAG TPA: putative zinc-binding metallopeptidase [Acidimicrobiales bacterium]|nr:putative zinc-binding metallopeptidase [Acidimicrobiales bacterium]
MRAFVCKRCRELVPFENQFCAHCHADVGFDPQSCTLETLRWSGGSLCAYEGSASTQWSACSQAKLTGCNWLVPADQAGSSCISCALTANRPPLKRHEYCQAFSKAEASKRRLVYQLLQLGLPVRSKHEDPDMGLCFELLASDRHVVTGHARGVITLDLNETDDVFREQTRAQFGEPYRTILGHFRHEIGHYYWLVLVATAPGGAGEHLREGARQLFGEYGSDYDAARNAHYSGETRDDWRETFVSAYASMHPLEDWAETFAHYLHIWDAVQTAASFGVFVGGPVDDRTGRRDPALASAPSEETATLEGFDAVMADWRPLTLALNALNRSLGKDDLYPFDLRPAVIDKLAFVHRVISGAST